MTTFTSPQATREAIAALFVAKSGAGQPLAAAYGNWPQVSEAGGLSPFVIVVDEFTEQDMAGQSTNPTRFGFVICAFVKMSSNADNTVNRADAADELATISTLIRQVIRDNVSNANWNNIRFEGRAVVQEKPFASMPYMIQPFLVIVTLANGAI